MPRRIQQLTLCTEHKRVFLWLTGEPRLYVDDNLAADGLFTDGIPGEDGEGIVFPNEPERFFGLVAAAYDEPYLRVAGPVVVDALPANAFPLDRMMTPEAFDAFAEDLAKANDIPIKRARELAAFIGDTPEEGPDGLITVRDNEARELARVRCPEAAIVVEIDGIQGTIHELAFGPGSPSGNRPHPFSEELLRAMDAAALGSRDGIDYVCNSLRKLGRGRIVKAYPEPFNPGHIY